MTVETATFLNSLNAALPDAADVVAQGDDHLRLVKSVLKATFPSLSFARYLEQPRVDVASASSPDIFGSGVTSNYIRITGTTQINDFVDGTNGQIKILTFESVMTLKHLSQDGGTTGLDLPSSADIVTAVGDHAIFIALGSTHRCIHYYRKSGKALVETSQIPSQTGHSGKDLTTDGSSLSFAFHPPIGVVVCWPGETAPSGWLECNGGAISRSTFANLFTAIGTTWGAGDGSTTFNIPDLRGVFVRGWDHGATRDPDRASRFAWGGSNTGDHVATAETDAFRSHTHNLDNTKCNTDGSGPNGSPPLWPMYDGSPATLDIGQPIQATGGNETRPLNVNLMYIIRAI